MVAAMGAVLEKLLIRSRVDPLVIILKVSFSFLGERT